MWNKLFVKVVARTIRTGRLHLTLPDGSSHVFGGTLPGPQVAAHLHDPALPRRILTNPEMALGEAYTAGTLTVTDDDLFGLIGLIVRSSARGDVPTALRLITRARKGLTAVAQRNPVRRAKQNVAHHYDLSQDFFALFLDQNQQYSCGYFRDQVSTLDEAQLAKMDHIAAKLVLRPGLRVLDIGCGWGGLSLRLAQQHDVHVTGVTLSEVQARAATDHAKALGLADKATFRLQDYRDVPDQFDRIVSVGMMEHVGTPHYHTYVQKIAQLLLPGGIALIHFIGRSSPPTALSPWFQKYIFPGGYAPAFSEVMPHVERAGLVMADLEVWRGHYDQTLQHWRARFEANLPAVRAMYDDRFIRMWRYYLISSELGFSLMHQVVFQMQLSHAPLTVPVTRDYLYATPP